LKIIYFNNHHGGKISKLTLGTQLFLKMKIVIEKKQLISRKRENRLTNLEKSVIKRARYWQLHVK
jgi:hypothetical protein